MMVRGWHFPAIFEEINDMALFTTRVELHGANWDDYTKLHSHMKAQDFALTVTSDQGSTYRLPPAEYTYQGTVSRDDVLNKAKAAAGAVKTSFAVVVTEAVGVTWFGLPIAA
jgi:hypothetical protein